MSAWLQLPGPGERGRPALLPPAIASAPAGVQRFEAAFSEYVVAGLGLRVEFLTRGDAGGKLDFLSLDEGVYRDGEWVPGRRLNGDEHHLAIGRDPDVRRARLYFYD